MTPFETLHLTVGGIALLFFVAQTFGTESGSDADLDVDGDGIPDFDCGCDSPEHAHSSLGDFLSIRNLTGFFMGYGLIAFICARSGFALPFSMALGGGAGLSMAAASFFLLRAFLRFQEDGSDRTEDLIGLSGVVYIELSESRTGKVLVDSKNGRLERRARSDSGCLTSGTEVEIVGTSGSLLLVRSVH